MYKQRNLNVFTLLRLVFYSLYINIKYVLSTTTQMNTLAGENWKCKTQLTAAIFVPKFALLRCRLMLKTAHFACFRRKFLASYCLNSYFTLSP